jgi:hypothetical protein
VVVTKTVSKEILRDEWDLPFGGTEEIEVVLDEMRHANRWSNTFELVIHDKRDDTYWSMTYNLGTGDEGECPWEYEREVELTQVVPRPVTTYKYVSVEVPDSTSTKVP